LDKFLRHEKYIDQLENNELGILLIRELDTHETILFDRKWLLKKILTVVDFCREPLKRLNSELENRNINKVIFKFAKV
jgi:hypothetical protein